MELTNHHVAEALKLAVSVHDFQKDLNGEPYILHPLNLWRQVALDWEHIQIVALLHDVVEDSSVTLKFIEKDFGKEVRDSIDAITKRDKESYEDYVARVEQDTVARRIKILDITHNLRPSKGLTVKRKEKYEKALAYLSRE